MTFYIPDIYYLLIDKLLLNYNFYQIHKNKLIF